MNRNFPKSKLVFVNLAILLIIFGGIRLVESGPEPWLASENVFTAQLDNSLWNLDRAKHEWAAEKNKAEDAVPTFEELAPYLGEDKKAIEKFQALGIEYKITSTETNQSDVATLTRGIRFRAAFCPYYRAGTTVCLHTGWKNPPTSTSPITFRILLILLHGDFFLNAAFFILVLANVIIFLVSKLTKPPKPSETEDTISASKSAKLSMLAGVSAKDLYVLIFGCLFCLLGLGFLLIIPPAGEYLIEKMGNVVGLLFTAASLVLPVLCLHFLKVKPVALRAAFLVSLVPAACILWSFLSAWFVALPWHCTGKRHETHHERHEPSAGSPGDRVASRFVIGRTQDASYL